MVRPLFQGTYPNFVIIFLYLIGKENEYENLRDWFKSLYEILLGQSDGPRMGSFISLYGISETVDLIQNAINGELK